MAAPDSSDKVMHTFCDLSRRILEIKEASRPERDRLRKQSREHALHLLRYMEDVGVERLVVPPQELPPAVPELIIVKAIRTTKTKITPEVATRAWQGVYDADVLEPLLQGGSALPEAVRGAFREKVDALVTREVAFADVVVKGAKGDPGETTPSGDVIAGESNAGVTTLICDAPTAICQVAMGLWRCKCELKELAKADKDATRGLEAEKKSLEGQVDAALRQVQGCCHQVSLGHGGEALFLRKKVSKSPGSVNLKNIEQVVTAPFEALLKGHKRGRSGGLPAVDADVVASTLQNAFVDHKKKHATKKQRIAIELAPDEEE